MLAKRFRGFFPVVIDVETGGFNHNTDALLEVAAITLKMDDEGLLAMDETFHFHVQPFEGANIEAAALEITGIDPFHPFREAVTEREALTELFKGIRKAQKKAGCQRSILVGHNASFDLNFINAAVERCQIKRNPLHPFSTFDTVTLSAMALGQTVLAKACEAAKQPFENEKAHSALYDTEQTAQLFCKIINKYQQLGGWPLPEEKAEEKTEEEQKEE
ncbi:ribonuclease T [Pleionea sp. CnH1-48]|uniref:ribonuclease T n=1 Tax=Pleionea sp. CnH1-48 TaxID=2954494 RepID=UPI002098030D|nr:ribonuclease T [Pleionea sp. CnH1-48]MCO7227199.1 ribonuclease T [Pleionea sp. CnH1-48]